MQNAECRMQNQAPAHAPLPRLHSSLISHHAAFRPRAFTLTEMLIVVGIIVLVVLVAVPSFRALTGGRSTEAAQNQLSGLLGRARADALGLQEIRGIAFFLDSQTNRAIVYEVRQAQTPTAPPPGSPVVDVYLDYVGDRDPILMPVGVGIQVVDDAFVTVDTSVPRNPALDTRSDDAYIGFNTQTVNGVPVTYGGVILFDGYGRVVSKRYAFKCYHQDATGTKIASPFSRLWEMTITAASGDLIPTGALPTRSQFGFVLYDLEPFTSLGYTFGDPQVDILIDGGTYTDHPTNDAVRSPEAREERWIDANAIPLLVNRNNGTLVRGQ